MSRACATYRKRAAMRAPVASAHPQPAPVASAHPLPVFIHKTITDPKGHVAHLEARHDAGAGGQRQQLNLHAAHPPHLPGKQRGGKQETCLAPRSVMVSPQCTNLQAVGLPLQLQGCSIGDGVCGPGAAGKGMRAGQRANSPPAGRCA